MLVVHRRIVANVVTGQCQRPPPHWMLLLEPLSTTTSYAVVVKTMYLRHLLGCVAELIGKVTKSMYRINIASNDEQKELRKMGIWGQASRFDPTQFFFLEG